MAGEHTPGPWKAIGTDPMEGVDCWWLIGADRRDIGTINGSQSDETSEANARLIAAAPELLMALRSLAGNAGAMRAFEHEIREVAGNTNWQCLMDAIAKADAAIAKARGAA